MKVWWSFFTYRYWTLYLAATDVGLCRITLPNESFLTLKQWLDRHIHDTQLVEDNNKLRRYREQLMEYLGKQRREFTVPLDFYGTPFQKSVWQALTRIPYGEVRTYAEVAREIGKPTAARAVGAANGANPLPIIVPCHRVIGKDGTLTGYRGGIDTKAQLLRLEGSLAG
jgi:methylated-DNA-[protein]-cysteine S-methyltransferase